MKLHTASGQLSPMKPPTPAFRMMASSFGKRAASRAVNDWTERRMVRSTFSE
jgi:hypothetical protein